MTGFVATAPKADEPPICVDFYPDIAINVFREAYRVDTGYSAVAVRTVLVDACLDVVDDLAPAVTAWQSDGYLSLTDVPSPMIDGVSRLVLLHRRAVYCFAKAKLLDAFRDVDTTRDLGHDRADDYELSSDDWQRQGRQALNKLQRRPTVEATLI